MAALKVVEEQMIDRGHRPILHIEAHGDEGGMQFSDHSSVEWTELRPILTRFNIKTSFNCFLVMAMCSGGRLSRLLLPFEPAPMWGVLGPTIPVSGSELFTAMEAFYRELLVSFDAFPAVQAMNQSYAPNDFKFSFMPAELIFCKAFRRYIDELTPANLQARENEIVFAFARGKGMYDLNATMQARVQARELLRTKHREFFEYCERNFFMLDKIPTNVGRFRASYQTCVEVCRGKGAVIRRLTAAN